MRLLILFILSIQVLSCKTKQKNRQLFQIIEGSKIGFINSEGEIIIKPQYLVAGNFSEGLVSVRINGRYGFIDYSGKVIIKAIFDYALDFKDSLALVYEKGIPYFINHQGIKLFSCNYAKRIGKFENGLVRITTNSYNSGYINKSGKLVIDTTFYEITGFHDGLSIVTTRKFDSSNKNDITPIFQTGVIDTLGNFVIPLGRFEDIGEYKNGYFRVNFFEDTGIDLDNRKIGFVDRNGKLIFSKKNEKYCSISEDINCGLIKVALYKSWLQDKNDSDFHSELMYPGFIDLNGKIIINDTNFKEANVFQENRCFIKSTNTDNENKCFIINKKGERINNKLYNFHSYLKFKNYTAIVSENKLYGVIDTNGKYIIAPKYFGFFEINSNLYLFKKDNNEQSLWGLMNEKEEVLCKPKIQTWSRDEFKNDLLLCIINDKMSYLNKQGEIIWQIKDNKIPISFCNIDFMQSAYFDAGSERFENETLSYAKSENKAKKLHLLKEQTIIAGLNILVKEATKKDTFMETYWGRKVIVYNNTKKTYFFNAKDSHLDMVVQARNSNGQWQDIEYLPNGFCGNSNHILTLHNQEYWEFITPNYSGCIPTRLRIKLKYISSKVDIHIIKRKEEIVYSNEYSGSVNPAQFWRKEEYFRTGIMNPYLN